MSYKMWTRVDLVDVDGKLYGSLHGINENSPLSDVRVLAAEANVISVNYLFVLRNVPISLKQEMTMKVYRCAKSKSQNPKVLEMIIMLRDTPESTTPNKAVWEKSKED